MSLDCRDAELSHLHPLFRRAVVGVQADLAREQIPLVLFEGFRSPLRQKFLHTQSPKVSHNGSWKSFHQYGLAADFVLRIDGEWSWDQRGGNAGHWQRLAEIGRAHGLDAMNYEKPHLQLAGITIDQLAAGRYPQGGDLAWAQNLEEAIVTWTATSHPPLPQLLPARPALAVAAE